MARDASSKNQTYRIHPRLIRVCAGALCSRVLSFRGALSFPSGPPAGSLCWSRCGLMSRAALRIVLQAREAPRQWRACRFALHHLETKHMRSIGDVSVS